MRKFLSFVLNSTHDFTKNHLIWDCHCGQFYIDLQFYKLGKISRKLDQFHLPGEQLESYFPEPVTCVLELSLCGRS